MSSWQNLGGSGTTNDISYIRSKMLHVLPRSDHHHVYDYIKVFVAPLPNTEQKLEQRILQACHEFDEESIKKAHRAVHKCAAEYMEYLGGNFENNLLPP